MRIMRLYDGVEGPRHIDYSLASIDELPFPDGAFDAVYSISVLEHTASPSRVVDEFARILRTGGLVLMTFDVCRDGSRPLTLQQAGRLLDHIADRFEIGEGNQTPLALQASNPKVLTTNAVARLDRDLLPWKFPGILYQVQAILRGRPLGPWPPSLAVYCLEGRKR
jgi:SAM-dependent methyltransferase